MTLDRPITPRPHPAAAQRWSRGDARPGERRVATGDGRLGGTGRSRLATALLWVVLAVAGTAVVGCAPGGVAEEGGAAGDGMAAEGAAADGEPVEVSGGDAAVADLDRSSPTRSHLYRSHLYRADPPVAPGAMAPQLAPARDGGVWMSWLEPTDGAEAAGPAGDGGGAGHRLRVAHFDGEAWGEARTVVAGGGFFANWADVPSVVEGEDGTLLAHWLAKTGADTYAYGVFLARSTDGGATWDELGTLHSDSTPTEHGFVSLLPAPGGGFDAVWLDGRGMVDGGPMTLRAARVAGRNADGGAVGPESVLDPRVCECCQTSAARAASGPLVVYRDRSEGEIRDVHAVSHGDDGWSAPRPVADDGWNISGCPVNGPAVAAASDRAVVAWFTAADGSPRVRAAFTRGDGGEGRSAAAPTPAFGPALEIDAGDTAAGAPLGRVDVALIPAVTFAGPDTSAPAGDGRAAPTDPPGTVGSRAVAPAAVTSTAVTSTAVVSWLGGDGGVWLRRVSAVGTVHPARRVASTATERASGFPRIENLVGGEGEERLAVAWVEPGSGDDPAAGTVRFATLPLSALPGGDARAGQAGAATSPAVHAATGADAPSGPAARTADADTASADTSAPGS